MLSSYVYYDINPMESSNLGTIIANGSQSRYLRIPNINDYTEDFSYVEQAENTYVSNNYGYSFEKVRKYLI